jgi:hypothetical protein
MDARSRDDKRRARTPGWWFDAFFYGQPEVKFAGKRFMAAAT